jgi:hypothetical protein
VGSCSFNDDVPLDHSNGRCAKFWKKIERVQVSAVVLAGTVSYAGLLSVSMVLVGSHIPVQNFTSRGDCLCYSHADNGTQEKPSSC